MNLLKFTFCAIAAGAVTMLTVTSQIKPTDAWEAQTSFVPNKIGFRAQSIPGQTAYNSCMMASDTAFAHPSALKKFGPRMSNREIGACAQALSVSIDKTYVPEEIRQFNS